MLTASKKTIQRSRAIAERLVDKHADTVKRFRNFSDATLDIARFNPMEIMEDQNGDIDPIKATKTAIMMANFLEKTKSQSAGGQLDETSRASLPSWIKNGLALIASAQSDDITDKVISVQPMSNRQGRIHYLDVVTERAKGNIPDRAKLFDALTGFRGTENLSSENVENEPVGPAGGVSLNVVLGYGPVIPGTLVITDGVQVVRDDRNGNIVGGPDLGAPGPGVTNSIDYLTKTLSFAFAVAASGPVTVKYQYNIEAALQLPEYGIHLRAEAVQARPRALGASWSQQAIMDFLADFGIDAEPTILEAGARIIAMEKFKHVVNTLRANATGGSIVFDNTAPAGVSYRDHIKTFALYLSRLQDLIWEATQVVRPNVFVFHPSIMFMVAFQDGFMGQKYSNDGVAGPRFVGRLTNHDLDCFCDPTFPRDQFLITHRGAEFVSTAAVMGEYIPLYKAPVHTRGFRKDFALLSEYVIKVVDSNQIGTGTVTNL